MVSSRSWTRTSCHRSRRAWVVGRGTQVRSCVCTSSRWPSTARGQQARPQACFLAPLVVLPAACCIARLEPHCPSAWFKHMKPNIAVAGTSKLEPHLNGVGTMSRNMHPTRLHADMQGSGSELRGSLAGTPSTRTAAMGFTSTPTTAAWASWTFLPASWRRPNVARVSVSH
jgi:hypothetical protein